MIVRSLAATVLLCGAFGLFYALKLRQAEATGYSLWRVVWDRTAGQDEWPLLLPTLVAWLCGLFVFQTFLAALPGLAGLVAAIWYLKRHPEVQGSLEPSLMTSAHESREPSSNVRVEPPDSGTTAPLRD